MPLEQHKKDACCLDNAALIKTSTQTMVASNDPAITGLKQSIKRPLLSGVARNGPHGVVNQALSHAKGQHQPHQVEGLKILHAPLLDPIKGCLVRAVPINGIDKPCERLETELLLNLTHILESPQTCQQLSSIQESPCGCLLLRRC